LPQACDQPASPNLPKGSDHRSPCSDAVGLKHHGVDRHVLLILMLRTHSGDSERLDDAIGLRIEADGGVLADHRAIEGRRGNEESE
jgi:hypothetical protein